MSDKKTALLKLLDDPDPYVRERVRQEIVEMRFEGLELVYKKTGSAALDDKAEIKIDILMDIIYGELQSELEKKQKAVEKLVYIVSLLESPYYPFSFLENYYEKMAKEVQDILLNETSQFKMMDALNEIFFVREEYYGNSNDYYNRANSCINQVIESKKGIPISLSMIYLAIARRFGLKISGVALPGHFMCRFVYKDFAGMIDVFHGGRVLTFAETRLYLASMNFNIDVYRVPDARPEEVAYRFLCNLINAYGKSRQLEKKKGVEKIAEMVKIYV